MFQRLLKKYSMVINLDTINEQIRKLHKFVLVKRTHLLQMEMVVSSRKTKCLDFCAYYEFACPAAALLAAAPHLV